MHYIILLMLLPFIAQGQSFTEICPTGNTNGTVVNFEHFDSKIYATGFFSQICGSSTQYVAEWDGTEWIPAAIPLTDPGHHLRSIDGKLYVARYEESIDSNWLYVYEAGSLSKITPGVYLTTASGFSELPNIYDVVDYQGDLVICGEFDRVGGDPISNIARWDGSGWAPLGGGLTGNISGTGPVRFPHTMLVSGTDLYVCGNFRFADTVEVNGIARWDGTSWHAVGAGFNSTVYGIGMYDGDLYAGGSFSSSGAATLRALARFNGTDWESPGFGFINSSPSDFTFVHTIKEMDGQLYVGGGLKRLLYEDGTEIDCGGIVRWNGVDSVDTFEGGIAGNDIEAITTDAEGNILIGGGVFGAGYVGILENPVSNIEVPAAISMDLFPNPFTEKLFISVDQPIQALQLFDLSGRSVATLDKATQLHDLSFLPPGMYTLLIQTEQGLHSEMITKSN